MCYSLDSFRKEAVMKPSGGSMDALVPSAVIRVHVMQVYKTFIGVKDLMEKAYEVRVGVAKLNSRYGIC